jgi:hypothetical protein
MKRKADYVYSREYKAAKTIIQQTHGIVDIVCHGDGEIFTERQLYKLFSKTIVTKQRVGLYKTYNSEYGCRWRWNIFPFSLQAHTQTIEVFHTDDMCPFTLAKIGNEWHLQTIPGSSWSKAIFHPKHKKCGLLTRYDTLKFTEEDAKEYLVDDTLVLELSYAKNAEEEFLLYCQEMCGTVTRIEQGATILYKWTVPWFFRTRFSPPMRSGDSRWYLTLPADTNRLPGIHIRRNSKLTSETVFGFLIRNFVNPLSSMAFVFDYDFSSGNSTGVDHSIEQLSTKNPITSEFIQNDTIELYFAMSDQIELTIGYELLPKDIYRSNVNAYKIHGSSHHGFVQCLDAQSGLFRIPDWLILDANVKGVLQYDRVDEQDVTMKVTLVSIEKENYELCVGVAPPKYSYGHVGWLGDSIGYQVVTGEICDGRSENGDAHVALTLEVLSVNDSVQVILTGDKMSLAVNGTVVFSTNFSKGFLPTISGVGCTFTVNVI